MEQRPLLTDQIHVAVAAALGDFRCSLLLADRSFPHAAVSHQAASAAAKADMLLLRCSEAAVQSFLRPNWSGELARFAALPSERDFLLGTREARRLALGAIKEGAMRLDAEALASDSSALHGRWDRGMWRRVVLAARAALMGVPAQFTRKGHAMSRHGTQNATVLDVVGALARRALRGELQAPKSTGKKIRRELDSELRTTCPDRAAECVCHLHLVCAELADWGLRAAVDTVGVACVRRMRSILSAHPHERAKNGWMQLLAATISPGARAKLSHRGKRPSVDLGVRLSKLAANGIIQIAFKRGALRGEEACPLAREEAALIRACLISRDPENLAARLKEGLLGGERVLRVLGEEASIVFGSHALKEMRRFLRGDVGKGRPTGRGPSGDQFVRAVLAVAGSMGSTDDQHRMFQELARHAAALEGRFDLVQRLDELGLPAPPPLPEPFAGRVPVALRQPMSFETLQWFMDRSGGSILRGLCAEYPPGSGVRREPGLELALWKLCSDAGHIECAASLAIFCMDPWLEDGEGEESAGDGGSSRERALSLWWKTRHRAFLDRRSAVFLMHALKRTRFVCAAQIMRLFLDSDPAEARWARLSVRTWKAIADAASVRMDEVRAPIALRVAALWALVHARNETRRDHNIDHLRIGVIARHAQPPPSVGSVVMSSCVHVAARIPEHATFTELLSLLEPVIKSAMREGELASFEQRASGLRRMCGRSVDGKTLWLNGDLFRAALSRAGSA